LDVKVPIPLGYMAVKAVESNGLFGRTYSLHLQGRRRKQTKNIWSRFQTGCAEDVDNMFHRNVD
jgi:hypothetical protein